MIFTFEVVNIINTNVLCSRAALHVPLAPKTVR